MISPASGWYTPVMTLMSVDFPAPFSPISAWISPGFRSKCTSSSARTPGEGLGDVPQLQDALSHFCELLSTDLADIRSPRAARACPAGPRYAPPRLAQWCAGPAWTTLSVNSRAERGKRYLLFVFPICRVGPGTDSPSAVRRKVVPALPCTTDSSVTGPFLTLIWMERPLPGFPW